MSENPDELIEPDQGEDVQDTPARPREPITPPKGTRRVSADELPPRAYNRSAGRQADSVPAARPRRELPASPSASQPIAPPVFPPPPNYSTANYYPPEAPHMPTGQRKGRARLRRDSGLYLPWWSLVVMLAAVGGLAFGALVVVNTMGGQAAPGGSTPIVVVITATYTIGPPASQTPIPRPVTLTPTPPLPTIAASVTLPPGNFVIGATVQIVGVGGSGLNVRSGPGKQFTAKFLAKDGEKYVLKEGPQTASDEEWWHIQDANNPNNDGWASRRFLTVATQ